MAVTPGEAAKINDANEKKAIKEMEEHIDGVLNKDFRTGTTIRMDIGDVRKAAGEGYSDRALEEVLNRFRGAGWAVKKKSNKGRYGGPTHDYMFSAAPPSVVISVVTTTPTQWDADNQGLPLESQR